MLLWAYHFIEPGFISTIVRSRIPSTFTVPPICTNCFFSVQFQNHANETAGILFRHCFCTTARWKFQFVTYRILHPSWCSRADCRRWTSFVWELFVILIYRSLDSLTCRHSWVEPVPSVPRQFFRIDASCDRGGSIHRDCNRLGISISVLLTRSFSSHRAEAPIIILILTPLQKQASIDRSFAHLTVQQPPGHADTGKVWINHQLPWNLFVLYNKEATIFYQKFFPLVDPSNAHFLYRLLFLMLFLRSVRWRLRAAKLERNSANKYSQTVASFGLCTLKAISKPQKKQIVYPKFVA